MVHAISVEWLQENIFNKLPPWKINRNTMLSLLQDKVNSVQEKKENWAASDMSFEEVLAAFDLHHEPTPKLKLDLEHPVYPPSDALLAMQAEIHYVIKGSPLNEAYARCILNNIIVCCLADEKRRVEREFNAASGAADDHGRPHTPLLGETYAPLTLRFETPLTLPVQWKNKTKHVNGKADFSLWYDDLQKMAINLVCVEVKRGRTVGQAGPQLAAYMGIVHRKRKDEGLQNSTVFGIATDGDIFKFWRIDNNSELRESRFYEWTGGQEEQSIICSFIRYILRAAVHSSPRTSPVKDHKDRGVTLALFDKAEAKMSMDFGLGKLKISGDSDSEDTDVEILHPDPIKQSELEGKQLYESDVEG